MKTIIIQIGNSDDKLTQREWAEFIQFVDMYIKAYGKVHFFGMSPSNAEWQNACWVAEVMHEDDLDKMKRLVSNCGKEFQQDSIAWTEGTTEFI